MKQLFVCIAMIPFFSFAQDTTTFKCDLNKEKDRFGKVLKISTGFITLNKGVSLYMEADSMQVDFFFNIGGINKCFDYQSTVMFFFEGGKMKYNYHNGGTVNCEGYFHLNFRNASVPSSLLTRLGEKKVISMKFSGTNKQETSLDITGEQQQTIMNFVNCMIAEAKAIAHY